MLTRRGAGSGSAVARSTRAGETRQTAVSGGRLNRSAMPVPSARPRRIAAGCSTGPDVNSIGTMSVAKLRKANGSNEPAMAPSTLPTSARMRTCPRNRLNTSRGRMPRQRSTAMAGVRASDPRANDLRNADRRLVPGREERRGRGIVPPARSSRVAAAGLRAKC